MGAMPRLPALAAAALATTGIALAAAVTPGCKRSKHARVTVFTPPPLPGGLRRADGRRLAHRRPDDVEGRAEAPAAWAVADPQAVDDFHANVNVVTEPFTGDSYDYARANEAALREQTHATVELVARGRGRRRPDARLESRWAPVPPSTVPYRTMQTHAVLARHGLRRHLRGVRERLRALPLDLRVDRALVRGRALSSRYTAGP